MINNYSYTPNILNEKNTIAYWKDWNGYASVTIEQWGSNPNKINYVVDAFVCTENGYHDITESFDADFSCYDEYSKAYENAMKLFNECVPESESMPLF